MLSPVLSRLHPPPKSPKPFSFHQLPTSKNHNLICGFAPQSPSSIGRLSVSDPRNMTESVGVDDFDGDNAAERRRLREAEAILGNGLYGFGREVAWGEVESVLNRMSKWLVAVLFGIAVLWKHDAEASWAGMGSVVNSLLSITLKHILNHQRPVPALRSDPGMPSSHAQSIFYIASYAFLSLLHWLGMNILTVTVGTLVLTCGAYLSRLRISQQLHTVNQVLVGAALGSMFAVAWFSLWHSFMLRAFISSGWVQILVVLGSALFWVAFLIYSIQHWLMDEQSTS